MWRSVAVVLADWTNLPYDVCKQVLCTDLSTFVSGEMVCQAWRTLTKQVSWGPNIITLPLKFSFSEPIIDKLDRIDNLVQRLAGPATQSFDLTVSIGSADGAPLQPLLSRLHGYSMLTALRLDCGVLEDWSFVDGLPECIASLNLLALSGGTSAQYPIARSLDCFNRFHGLKQLRIHFITSQHSYVSGRLKLPCLEELVLTGCQVTLRDMHLERVPSSCIVVSDCSLADDLLWRVWAWIDKNDAPIDEAIEYWSMLSDVESDVD